MLLWSVHISSPFSGSQCPIAPCFPKTATSSPFSDLWELIGQQPQPSGPTRSGRRRCRRRWRTPPTERGKQKEAGGPAEEEGGKQRRGRTRERSGSTSNECSRRRGCWDTTPALGPVQVRPQRFFFIHIYYFDYPMLGNFYFVKVNISE